MRYCEKKQVSELMKWLAERDVCIHRDTYQAFIRRVLGMMSDAVAEHFKVDLTLLRAIRARLKLPLAPVRRRASSAKATRPFYARSPRQRRIGAPKKPKHLPSPATACLPHHVPLPVDLRPLAGVVASSAKPDPETRNALEDPQNYREWKNVNAIVRKKLAQLNRSVFTNYQGRAFNNRTKEEYEPEDLVRLFQLTTVEAKSCFMSFTQ